jgi:hypothetical protein
MMITIVSTILGLAALGSAAAAKDPPGGTRPATTAAQAKQFMDIVAPKIRPISVDAKPQIRKDAVRKKLLFGPHVIPAAKV